MKCAIAALSILAACSLQAQDARGRIQGTVSDSTQAVVVGAKVVLTNDETNVAVSKISQDNGHYLFDLVNAGTYTITVEQPGFARFVQQNVKVVVRGDMTVDVVLKVGGTTETVTVTEAPPQVQFNTSTMDQVVENKMVRAMPTLARNPFALAMLDPAVTNGATGMTLAPYNKWQTAGYNVGGGASGARNDLLLDGSAIQIGTAGSYVPPMDAVQEFSVQQNGVDAEFGHSAGGVMNVSMKTGTNSLHGTGYYFGVNPLLNARPTALGPGKNLSRNSIWGGTVGGPIKKNKLFTFLSYEQWIYTENNVATFTMPTAAEKAGDFSKSLTSAGLPRTIYDPTTTVFEPASGSVTRQPFANNQIPQARMDATALKIAKDIWLPNNPGINLAGQNNYILNYPRYFRYWNISDRTDYNVTGKLKIFGRYSRFTHHRDPQNYANSPAVPANGYLTQSRDYVGDVVYTLSPKTLLDVRMSYASLVDDLRAAFQEIGVQGLSNFWPNQWFQSYVADAPIVFYPGLQFTGGFGTTSIGKPQIWQEHAHTYSYSARLASQQGRHYLKSGLELRRAWGQCYYPTTMTWIFGAGLTSNTFINTNTSRSGDPYATFLLGALSSNEGVSTAYYTPLPTVTMNYWSGYFQDDFKVSRNLTLNLGMRYEYFGGIREANGMLSQELDQNAPISDMQGMASKFPASVLQYNATYRFNGAWKYTPDAGSPAFGTPKNTFLPRFGAAYRLNDKMALRVGYARYGLPLDTLATIVGAQNLYGFSATTTTAPSLNGQPGGYLADPFPASNPLIQPVGRANGARTNLGGSANWYKQDPVGQGFNDRLSVSFQRQLPQFFALDVTFFQNFGTSYPYSKNMNIADPNLSYTYKTALSATVANPFYKYPGMPGQLANQANVTISSLLKPYPQYGSLSQDLTPGPSERYRSLQIRAQRQYTNGLSILATYMYFRERTESNGYTDIDTYNNNWRYIGSTAARHRFVSAGTYDFPFGKGRRFLGGAHGVVDAVLGGWTLSATSSLFSGQFLSFGGMLYNGTGSPSVYRRPSGLWFDTAQFAQLPAFTLRSNPVLFEGLTGPRSWNVDAAMSKLFRLTERFGLEFRMDAYNMTNTFIPSNPTTSVTSSSFGRSTGQMNQGRTMQYTARIQF